MSSNITPYGFGWIARKLSGDNRPITMYAIYTEGSDSVDISGITSVDNLPKTKIGVSNVSAAVTGNTTVYSVIIPETAEKLNTSCSIQAVALCDDVGVIASGNLASPIKWIAGASIVVSLPITIGEVVE